MPSVNDRVLLAVESSCDETAVAVIDADRRVLASVIASQDELHRRWGGVVPEVASRAHLERILPCLREALDASGRSLADVGAIAAVTEPGLVGSLLVGLTAAKTLAWTLGVPLVAVNHVEAHLYACRWAADGEPFPAVGLVASGGHTSLYDCRSTLDFELLGTTIDDAAGEAFDKAAALLGLPYPGGPALERAAVGGRADAVPFPRAFLHEPRLEFSFSGLKTALLYAVRGQPNARQPPPSITPERLADLAASFQAAVIDVLAAKCEQALAATGRDTLCIGGGVAANRALRARLEQLADRRGIRLLISPREYCTDNAAMAAIAWDLLEAGRVSPLDIDVTPGLVRKRDQNAAPAKLTSPAANASRR
ncbi:MAG: tRNA (adenosine(37)-N6)-threonylcarbamoyltransferase complex transferase subunit TsaD [Planctomyces sp.]|nr:tRNA (adenosine(37)-N6)-threonylcarbamoyltransferase complex transferase subunit TsaD [Planctomyces sp.]